MQIQIQAKLWVQCSTEGCCFWYQSSRSPLKSRGGGVGGGGTGPGGGERCTATHTHGCIHIKKLPGTATRLRCLQSFPHPRYTQIAVYWEQREQLVSRLHVAAAVTASSLPLGSSWPACPHPPLPLPCCSCIPSCQGLLLSPCLPPQEGLDGQRDATAALLLLALWAFPFHHDADDSSCCEPALADIPAGISHSCHFGLRNSLPSSLHPLQPTPSLTSLQLCRCKMAAEGREEIRGAKMSASLCFLPAFSTSLCGQLPAPRAAPAGGDRGGRAGGAEPAPPRASRKTSSARQGARGCSSRRPRSNRASAAASSSPASCRPGQHRAEVPKPRQPAAGRRRGAAEKRSGQESHSFPPSLAGSRDELKQWSLTKLPHNRRGAELKEGFSRCCRWAVH